MSEYAPQPGRMSISSALGDAWEHTRRMLFPFRFEVWISIGVIAFIEALGQGGGGGSGGGNFGGGGRGGGDIDVSHAIRNGLQIVQENLVVVLLVGIVLLSLIIGVGLLFLWLGSRGSMMLVRAVGTTDHRIGDNWRAVREVAWSLFLFRVVLAAINMVVGIVLLSVAALIVIPMAHRDTAAAWSYVVALMPLFLVGLVFGFVMWLIGTLTRNFVAPLMLRFDLTAVEGWRRFRDVSRGNLGAIVLFLLVRFAYYLAYAGASFFACAVTCCLGMLPVIHHAIFAPFYVFDRAFSLFLLGSAGPEYAMVVPVPDPVAPPERYEPAPLLDEFPERDPGRSAPPPPRDDAPPPDDPFRNPFDRER